MTCYACEREPTQQCKRCGRPYCDEHGDDFCNECLKPSSGVPSFTLYRGSLLALLIGTAVAVWLLVQPTNGEEDLIVRSILTTPTATAVSNIASPVSATIVPVAGTPAGGTPVASATPRLSPAAGTPTATAAPGTPIEYTVAAGDSLSAICSKAGPARLSNLECVAEIKRLNNLTSDAISVGDKLKVPQ